MRVAGKKTDLNKILRDEVGYFLIEIEYWLHSIEMLMNREHDRATNAKEHMNSIAVM